MRRLEVWYCVFSAADAPPPLFLLPLPLLQDSLDLVVAEFDYHGNLSNGEHAVARRYVWGRPAAALIQTMPVQGATDACAVQQHLHCRCRTCGCRALVLKVPKPAQAPQAAQADSGAAEAAAAARVEQAAAPQLIWGGVQLLVGAEAPPLPEFATDWPPAFRKGKPGARPALLSKAVQRNCD